MRDKLRLVRSLYRFFAVLLLGSVALLLVIGVIAPRRPPERANPKPQGERPTTDPNRPAECQYLPEGKALDACYQRAAEENLRKLHRIIALNGIVVLRKQMRDPDNFHLERALLMSDGTACYEYRAPNGFGGMNAEWAVLTSKGRWYLMQSADDVWPWNHYCANKHGELLDPVGVAGP